MSAAYDLAVPAVLFKIGRYPLSAGAIGAVRSLGRLGIEVHAVAEDPYAPHAWSRFLAGTIRLPSHGADGDRRLLEALGGVGKRLARPAVLIATDDEAAIFVAQHADHLRRWFLLPRVEPRLVRRLSSKRRLSELCREHGVATPRTRFARSRDEVMACAAAVGYPFVLKNSEPWVRLHAPAVGSTTVVHSLAALQALAARWRSEPQVVIQEYIPAEWAQDWIVAAYFDADSRPLAAFTARKYRSWPAQAGVTAAGQSEPNPELLDLSVRFCRAIGYRGIADMDWRLDGRDGRYSLVDFNPRMGANFRLLVNAAGIDVVRAQHLDLTGRAVPVAPQVMGRKFVVEHLNLASRLAKPRGSRIARGDARGGTEFAWFAVDDPIPFLMMVLRFTLTSGSRGLSLLLAAAAAFVAERRRHSRALRRLRTP
ncbi:MAG: ATP-grasp domain-containing protein [Rhodospirillaceae bacterium]|nr:ATP-grasp domain-containing protein [Rhodospirillaceae bacterium]